MIKKIQHLDPPRYPKLINPIEESMKKQFDITLDKIKIDFSKRLIQEVKK